MSKFLIRNVNWNKVDLDGIPYDFIDVINFFNESLKTENYNLIPRRNEITREELIKIWVPSRNNTITYLAEDKESKKVICSATLFVENNIGELSITKDVNYKVKSVGYKLTKKIIEESLNNNIDVSIHTSVKNIPMIKIMDKLGYKSTLVKDYDKYKNKIICDTYDAYYWFIKE